MSVYTSENYTPTDRDVLIDLQSIDAPLAEALLDPGNYFRGLPARINVAKVGRALARDSESVAASIAAIRELFG